MTPQLLIVGQLVKDVHPDGWRTGGSALYAAAQACRLGVETAVVTACGSEITPRELVSDARWHVIDLEASTRFENIYNEGNRQQRVFPAQHMLGLTDIPEEWRRASMTLLAPVFQDVDEELAGQLVKDSTIIAVGAQGWLREADGDVVVPASGAQSLRWLRGDIAFVSEEDVQDSNTIQSWLDRVPVVVLTRGRLGVTIWDTSGEHKIEAVSGDEKDPTGAGDVFSAAFLVRFGETGDAVVSGRFAASAASLAIEGEGITAIGNRDQIEARLRRVGVV